MKNILIRFVNGFCYSVAITMVVHLLIMKDVGDAVMLPEFAERFESDLIAFGVQLLLIGIMSGVTSAGTVLFELKRPGLLWQSILFLCVMLAVWIPTACYVWGFHKYLTSMISSLASIIATYGICWGIQYKLCRRDVQEINQRLHRKEVYKQCVKRKEV